MIRLQKFIAQTGHCSRREAETLIKSGRVKVNGKTVVPGKGVKPGDKVQIDGKTLKFSAENSKPIVLAFYKPVGVECTLALNPHVPTLADYSFPGGRLFPVGRLDKDSHGLLLMTNDGDLANQLAHPRYAHRKEYIVVTSKPLKKQQLTKLGNGSIELDGKPVKACEIRKVAEKVFEIVLTEGRNRQIRRMCEACDLKVVELLRVKISSVELAELKPGRWRHLSQTEIKKLKG